MDEPRDSQPRVVDVPRVQLETDKFRVVQLPNGSRVVEKFDGRDALGQPRWRELKFAEAADVATMLRNWMFDHLRVCPVIDRED